jgi:hypothetical protein
VIAIAIVPALVGATGGRSLAQALADGYGPAMLAMAGLCAVSAIVTALFVSDERFGGLHLPPHPHTHACALPVPNPGPGA